MLPLTDEQRELAAEALDRADSIAHRYTRVFPGHADDLKSTASWAALLAATEWNPEGHVDWKNFSYHKINQEILDFLNTPEVQRVITGDSLLDAAEKWVMDTHEDDIDTLLNRLSPTHRALCIRRSRTRRLVSDSVPSMDTSCIGRHSAFCGNALPPDTYYRGGLNALPPVASAITRVGENYEHGNGDGLGQAPDA